MQFGVGALYVGTLWLLKLRPPPTLEPAGKKAVVTVGFWHCTGQLAAMISLGAGPVSFTHMVKALEPFFSAVVSALAFGKWMKPQVYATLLPVVGGVGYACLKERSFSWLAFSFAMVSNLAFALRAVLSKVAMTGTGIGTNLTSENIFGLVTWAAFFISIPMALVGEGSSFGGMWTESLKTQDKMELVKAIAVSGMFHYLNNEVMYLALGNVHPVTLAVGNTMKRVIIMVASVMVFHNEISVQAGIGSAVGISGVLLYSLTKQKYEKLEQQELLASITKQKYEKLEQQELLASKEKKLTDVVNRARIAKRR
jgi:solute carrier family 35 protein E1